MRTAHISADDIRKEHEAAMASLTPAQRQAIERLAQARRMATFNHRWAAENLRILFDAEAAQRDGALRSAA